MSCDRGTQTNKRQKKVAVGPSATSEDATGNEEEEEEYDEDPNRESVPIDRSSRMTEAMSLTSKETVFSCEFEVFGIVQGVSFRMYTLRRAQKLGVRGWCQNSNTNTVKGEIEGHYNAFEEMRLWLKYTGSPTSRIDKVVFSDTIEREQFTFDSFSIVVE